MESEVIKRIKRGKEGMMKEEVERVERNWNGKKKGEQLENRFYEPFVLGVLRNFYWSAVVFCSQPLQGVPWSSSKQTKTGLHSVLLQFYFSVNL